MDDVVHGEKIMRVVEFGDQREFFAQGGAQRGIDVAAEIFVDAGPGQVFQMLLRGLALRHRLVRILVFELIKRKRNAAGKAHGFRDRLGELAKQPRHFMGRLEVTFSIGLQTFADGVDGGLLADTSQHILQRPARGMVVQHLVGGEQPHLCACREMMQPRQPALVVAAIEQACGEPDAIGFASLQSIEDIKGFLRLEAMRKCQHQELALGKFQEVA